MTSYGIKAKAQIKAGDITLSGGRNLRFNVLGKSIELNSCGVNNVYNALAAYACGLLFGVPTKEMALALEKFEFPTGRGQIVSLGRGWLINDAYNANPVSMRSALQTLEAISVQGQKIMVVADMLELGDKAKLLHERIGVAIARSKVDVLITVGRLAGYLANQARRTNKKIRVFACQDVDAAQQYLAKTFSNGDAVLVKGSRRMKMEQVVEFLLASPQASLT